MIETVITILHYENEKLTNQCIDSIHTCTESGTYRIVVVDNNSPTPYVRRQSIDWDLTVVRNDDRGSVSGMNFGFYHALYKLGYNPKYIVYFDSDIICLPNWLPPMVKEMEDNPSTGICGPKQWDEEQKLYRCMAMDMVGMVAINYPEERMNVVWLWGAATMIRADMMRRIGMHDDKFKTYCSDSDYCIHALSRGWEVVFVPESNVIHIGSSSYTTSPSSTDLADKQHLVGKWYGMNFAQLAKKFPFSIQEKTNFELSLKTVPITVKGKNE